MFNKIKRLRLQKKIRELIRDRNGKLHVGCGTDYLEGYINLDSSPDVGADLVMDVSKLIYFRRDTIKQIECYHFIEHLDYYFAKKTIREFYRILEPGGMVLVELPNFDVCIKSLGRYFVGNGIDVAMCGIYGHPPDVAKYGIAHLHKWGWTFTALKDELTKAGFIDVKEHEIKQKYREGTIFNRDMQVRAYKPVAIT